jgi:SAM-dependent methyltransferase
VTVRETAQVAPQTLPRAALRSGDARSAWNALVANAAEPYRKAGHFAYGFARGKLNFDPIFGAILRHDLLGTSDRVLDLGCGQGLLAAWLHAATRCHQIGLWPRGWPQPRSRAVRGIELMPREVARGRRALGALFNVVEGDIRTAEFGATDAVVVLDVMHYMPPDAQIETLRRIRTALSPGGLLLMRVGDADAGARFHFTYCLDRLIMLARGHGWFGTWCRPVEDWRALLADCAFDGEARWMSRGTPFANVLLIARAR